MFKLSGKDVNYLLKVCGRSSTTNQDIVTTAQTNLDKSLVFQNCPTFTSQAYPQLKTIHLPLVEQVFYPVYTGPIITTKI